VRADRWAREQRRHHAREPVPRDVGGGVAAGDRRRPDRGVPLLSGRCPGDARSGRRLDRDDLVAAGPDRLHRPGSLLGRQGRPAGPDQVDGAGTGTTRDTGQRRRAGGDDHRHGVRRHGRRGGAEAPGRAPGRPVRPTRGGGGVRRVPALRRRSALLRPDTVPQRRRAHAVRLVTPEEAVRAVPSGATVLVGGSGGGHAIPQKFIDTLAGVFTAEGSPRDLTTVRVVGLGDFAARGFSQLALPGLQRRTIGSNIGNEPRLGELVERGEVEAYSFPQGVLSQLCREIAAGRPGVFTQVGLGTYVDPRQTGGKQGSASEDLVEVVEFSGREWLFFKAFPIDVAVIRGTTIDEDGNLTMEDEAIRGEMLAMAMA